MLKDTGNLLGLSECQYYSSKEGEVGVLCFGLFCSFIVDCGDNEKVVQL